MDPRIKDVCFSTGDSRRKANKKILRILDNGNQHQYLHAERDKQVDEELKYQNSSKRTKFDLWSFVAEQAILEDDEKNIQSVSSELERYLKEICCKGDIFKWWKERNEHYPHLFVLAKKYLSIFATPVASERCFSKAGEIKTKKRSSISAKHLNAILFLNHNYSIYLIFT